MDEAGTTLIINPPAVLRARERGVVWVAGEESRSYGEYEETRAGAARAILTPL